MAKTNAETVKDAVIERNRLRKQFTQDAAKDSARESACCVFHFSGGTRELSCDGYESNFEGRHSRNCSVQGGGDCTCGVGPFHDEKSEFTPEQQAAASEGQAFIIALPEWMAMAQREREEQARIAALPEMPF